LNTDEPSPNQLNNVEVNKGLHPRNLHNNGYDFPTLIATFPALKAFVKPNKFGDQSIDFADPSAVKALNCALLTHHYGIAAWDVPKGYLCPPIPGRVDYIHHVADLLESVGIGGGEKDVRLLDIGTGANGIYSLLAAKVYGWQCTGSDIDTAALRNVVAILDKNPSLIDRVELRQQTEPNRIFTGIVKSSEHFDVSVCNPPFHASEHEAMKSNRRKVNSLAHYKTKNDTTKTKVVRKPSPTLNFGGISSELWCEGGEIGFLKTMMNESKSFGKQCRWFTTLVSKADNLKPAQWLLHDLQAKKVKVIDMQQGNKSTRILAWTFI
jgi:23S rRNA (adenine1618-N6)-methyltransferase